MSGVVINTFENLLGAGLIVSALIMTAGIEESGDGRDTADAPEEVSGIHHASIEDRLWVMYALDSDLGPFNLDIDVHGKTAVIHGVVSGAQFKNLAGNIALGLDEIDQVDNRILVVETMSAIAG